MYTGSSNVMLCSRETGNAVSNVLVVQHHNEETETTMEQHNCRFWNTVVLRCTDVIKDTQRHIKMHFYNLYQEEKC